MATALDKPEPAHAELVEARTTLSARLDKLGMSGVGAWVYDR